jgi:multiple sugar transport system substrate-binding protein
MSACSKGSSSSNAGGGENASGTTTLKMWTHNAGNDKELASITAIVDDYNASQTKYKVEIQAFPQSSYNQSVTAAATSKTLPCILDVDGPNVPNWAWAGYLTPLVGMDDTLSKFLPSVVGKWADKTYSYGYYDVSLALITLKSTLDEVGARVPTIDEPWTADEFADLLTKVKATGKFENTFDLGTADVGEWYPYAYSPLLQSFGGDLINRTDYKSAEGVLNGDAAVEWATWMQNLVKDGYTPAVSGNDAGADFINGKTGVLWSGQWQAVNMEAKFGDDVLFLPPVDFGDGPKVGGGSWQWAVSTSCGDVDGAMDYMKFAAADKYVASVSTATFNIPATDAAAATVPGYEAGGKYDLFRQYSSTFAVIRPPTPGYVFIATSFTKTVQDILNGADVKPALDQLVSDVDANQESNNFFETS